MTSVAAIIVSALARARAAGTLRVVLGERSRQEEEQRRKNLQSLSDSGYRSLKYSESGSLSAKRARAVRMQSYNRTPQT